MIHYHGTPIGGTRDSSGRFAIGRHLLVPWPRQEDLPIAVHYAQSFVVDNGAFSAWTKGVEVNWPDYYQWVDDLKKYPNFDWAIIPDVIGGTEAENDALLDEWPHGSWGVPVWHGNEPVERLVRLVHEWPRVSIGAIPEHPPNSDWWWRIMSKAFDAVTDADGYVLNGCRLHGLRMLNPAVFRKLPLASADSASVARNSNDDKSISPSRIARLEVMASRFEHYNAAPRWERHDQQDLFTAA